VNSNTLTYTVHAESSQGPVDADQLAPAGSPEVDPKPWVRGGGDGMGGGYRTDYQPWFSEEAFEFQPRAGYSQNPDDYR